MQPLSKTTLIFPSFENLTINLMFQHIVLVFCWPIPWSISLVHCWPIRPCGFVLVSKSKNSSPFPGNDCYSKRFILFGFGILIRLYKLQPLGVPDETALDEESGSAAPGASRPHFTSLPESFDVRNFWPDCKARMSIINDQGYCQGCWAIAMAEVVQDRMCISQCLWANF